MLYTEEVCREKKKKGGTFFIGQRFFYWSVNVDDEKGNRINFSIYKKLGEYRSNYRLVKFFYMMGHLIWCYCMFHQAQNLFELVLDINQAKDQDR